MLTKLINLYSLRFSNDSRKLAKVVYISDGEDWVISRIGRYISSCLKSQGLPCIIKKFSTNHYNSIIHFGSVHTFSKNNYEEIDPSNKLIVTIFHGYYGLNQDMDETINKIVAFKDRLDCIVVSNSIMKKRVASWGIDQEKISLIPLGVDLQHFISDESARRKTRKKLGIPEDAVCIGSFEKDGEGWNEGLIPKLIKGPDVFVEVVGRLAKEHRVHCLLTGPARGYVKKNLKAAGVSFTHRFVKRYLDIVDLYNCLDLYISASRDQGGPESLLESMATGIPLVSTRAGMAPDIIKDGQNGLMADVDDVSGLVECCGRLLENKKLRESLIQGGLSTVRNYDWPLIAGQYKELYLKI